MGHTFVVGSILQFTITAADLAIRAKVVALAEDQGKDELAGSFGFLGVGPHHHVVADRQRTGRLQSARSFHFHEAEAAASVR